MQTISATEAKNNLASVMHAALKEPVMIEKNGQPLVVMMSAEDYQAVNKKQQAEAFVSLCAEMAKTAKKNGMTKEILEAILHDAD